jgi:hypothetical protein
MGFTGGSGGFGAIQTISNFVFNSLAGNDAPIQLTGNGTSFTGSVTANLQGLAPGQYFLYAAVPDGTNPVVFSPLSLTTVAAPTPIVQGQVTALDGSVVAGAQIQLVLTGGPTPTTAAIVTDVNGNFFFDGPDDGVYTATATLTLPYNYQLPAGASLVQTSSGIAPGQTATFNWQLQQGAAITGTVTDPVVGHMPVPMPGVTVFDDLNGNGKLDPNEPRTKTDSRGRYTFNGVAPGDHSIVVLPPAGYVFTTTGSRLVHVQHSHHRQAGIDVNMTRQGGSAPTSRITYPDKPVDGIARWLGSISGTAHAPLGHGDIARVEVSVLDQATGAYWNGTSFVTSSSPIYLKAKGTSAWLLPLPAAALTNGHTYQITSRAVDKGELVQEAPSTRTFTIPLSSTSITLPTTLPDATVGLPYSQGIANLRPGLTFRISAGSLPQGLTLDSATGLISGMIDSPIGSPFSFTLSVDDGAGNAGSRAYTLAVASPLGTFPGAIYVENLYAQLLHRATDPGAHHWSIFSTEAWRLPRS